MYPPQSHMRRLDSKGPHMLVNLSEKQVHGMASRARYIEVRKRKVYIRVPTTTDQSQTNTELQIHTSNTPQLNLELPPQKHPHPPHSNTPSSPLIPPVHSPTPLHSTP